MFRARPIAFAVCAGAVCGLPGLGQPEAAAQASLYLSLALLLCLAAPVWARGEASRIPGALACVALAVGAGAVLGLFGAGVHPLALLWLLLFGATLVGLTRIQRGARGQLLASVSGLLLLAWPYLGLDDLLPAETALAAAVRSPLAVLSGSFADFDVLRGSLYAEFDAAQQAPYAYLAPAAALGWVAAAAGLAWAVSAMAAGWRWRGSTPLVAPRAATLVALVAIAAAGQGNAQEILTPNSGGGQPQIGDLTTRVQLGYWVPSLRGELRVDGENDQQGSKISLNRTLDLDPLFVMPTFEVSLGWSNGGRLWIQYVEGAWNGETQSARPIFFEEQVFPSQTFIDSRYKYRSIAVGGELYIPIFEWAMLRIVTIQRYMKHEVRLRGFNGATTFRAGRDSLETFVPTIGGGVDVFAWGVVTVYGDMQWLDFRTSMLGGEEGQYEVNYREWRVGVRLELIEHAHVLGEWFSLEHRLRRGNSDERESYQQELNGVRIQVAILF